MGVRRSSVHPGLHKSPPMYNRQVQAQHASMEKYQKFTLEAYDLEGEYYRIFHGPYWQGDRNVSLEIFVWAGSEVRRSLDPFDVVWFSNLYEYLSKHRLYKTEQQGLNWYCRFFGRDTHGHTDYAHVLNLMNYGERVYYVVVIDDPRGDQPEVYSGYLINGVARGGKRRTVRIGGRNRVLYEWYALSFHRPGEEMSIGTWVRRSYSLSQYEVTANPSRKQTASQHCLRLCGMKPTVLDPRNLSDLHSLVLLH